MPDRDAAGTCAAIAHVVRGGGKVDRAAIARPGAGLDDQTGGLHAGGQGIMSLTITAIDLSTLAAPGTNFNTGNITTAVGDVLLFFVAASNDGASGAASGIQRVLQTTDNSTTTGELISTNYDPGSAEAGTTLYVWRLDIVVAKTATNAQIVFSNITNQAACVIYKIQASAGTVAVRSTGAGATGNSAAPTITATSVGNGDTIFGAISIETDDVVTADSDTSNGSWSTQQTICHDTGADAVTETIAVQYKTVTATANQTYNPTLGTARDYAINYLVIYESAPASSFIFNPFPFQYLLVR